jgi:hypothetical protein
MGVGARLQRLGNNPPFLYSKNVLETDSNVDRGKRTERSPFGVRMGN